METFWRSFLLLNHIAFTVMIPAVMMKKTLIFFTLVLGLLLLGKCWHWAKDGFNIHRIRSAFPPIQGESMEDPEVLGALDQPFFYIGRGHQCYAFSSKDGRFVLKLPRLDQYEIPLWLKSLKFPFLDVLRQKKRDDTERRYDFIRNSFSVAFHDLKEETALLYLHLNQTDTFHRKVKIRDRIGRSYELDLDRAFYILQKRTQLMMPQIKKALSAGDLDEAKKILDAFLQMVEKRSRKGLFNKDASFLRNYGFDGEKGIQIDIGSFYRKKGLEERRAFESSFLEGVIHVRNWLFGLDPEITAWFDERIQQILSK